MVKGKRIKIDTFPVAKKLRIKGTDKPPRVVWGCKCFCSKKCNCNGFLFDERVWRSNTFFGCKIKVDKSLKEGEFYIANEE